MILLLFMIVKLDRMHLDIFFLFFFFIFYSRAKKTLNSKKYGVDLIRFTHATNTVIHSSTKIDGTLRTLFFGSTVLNACFF